MQTKSFIERKEIEKYIVGVLLNKPQFKNAFYFHDKDFSIPEYRNIVFGIVESPEDYSPDKLIAFLLGKGCGVTTLMSLWPSEDYLACPQKEFLAIADRLREDAMLYELEKTVGQAKTYDEIISKANELSALKKIYEVNTLNKAFSKYYDDYVEKQEKVMKGESVFVNTGMKYFDMGVHMEPCEFIVLGARTSIGKTMFALWLAYKAALNKHRVLYINLEMSQNQLMNRILAIVNHTEIADYRFFKADINQGIDRLEKIGENFLIEDGAGMKTDTIRKLIMSKNKIDLVIIDYINLLSDRADTEQRRLTEISNKLKRFAKERECVILGLCQLNREAEKQNREPDLADIKDSSGIEQAADSVVLLHKEDRKLDELKLFIRKQRNGQRWEIPYYFEASTTSYRELQPETLTQKT